MNTKEREALSVKQPCCVEDTLKMALEALELTANKFQKQRDAITAIKEALANHIEDNLAMVAQPAVTPSHKQDPVRIMGFDCVCGRRMEVSAEQRVEPSPQRTAEQSLRTLTWVNATPWRGLTVDELIEISKPFEGLLPEGWMKLTSAVEAKLKAKNERKEKNI